MTKPTDEALKALDSMWYQDSDEAAVLWFTEHYDTIKEAFDIDGDTLAAAPSLEQLLKEVRDVV